MIKKVAYLNISKHSFFLTSKISHNTLKHHREKEEKKMNTTLVNDLSNVIPLTPSIQLNNK